MLRSRVLRLSAQGCRAPKRHFTTTGIEMPSGFAGSVKPYEKHVLLPTDVPHAQWSKKPEDSNQFLRLFLEELGRAREILEPEFKKQNVKLPSVKVTLVEVASHDPFPLGSAVIFPRGLIYHDAQDDIHNFALDVLAQGMDEKYIGTTKEQEVEKVKTLRELFQQFHTTQDYFDRKSKAPVFNGGLYGLVCAHTQRDYRCGNCGPDLLHAASRLTGETWSGKGSAFGLYAGNIPMRLWPSSHIGGHRFAGNLVMFPNCDYYGHITPDNLDDVLRHHMTTLKLYNRDVVARNPVLAQDKTLSFDERLCNAKASEMAWLHWRGGIGMNQDDMLTTRQHRLASCHQTLADLREEASQHRQNADVANKP